MDYALQQVVDAIEAVLAAGTALLDRTEDPDESRHRLDALATSFVGAAMRIRQAQEQDRSQATRDFIRDAFHEVFRVLPAEVRERFSGEASFHLLGHMSEEGVSPPQSWKVRFEAVPP